MSRAPSALRHAVVVACLGVACLLGVSCASKVTLKVSRAELQERLDKKFPISKRKSVFELKLSDPRLTLVEQADLLQLALSAEAFALGTPLGRSEVTVQGGVHYDKELKAFFLTDPHLTGLDVAHIPERYHDKLRKSVDIVVHEILPMIPIYKLDKSSFKHSLSRAFLRRAWVADHALYLEMGF